MSSVAVIGSGITGITTAYSLAKRGYDVTVIDRCRYAAMETSYANGGQLSASNAEVWNSMSTVLKGLRWLTKPDAPLLFHLSPSWHKYSWMAEFVAQIPNYKKNTIKTAKLAITAREYLNEIAEQEGIKFDYEKRGILHIYRDKKSFDAAKKVTRLLKQAGLERVSVTTDEIKSIEPAINKDLYAGFYTPSDSSGDIHKFSMGLHAACKHRGVEFIYETSVEKIEHLGNEIKIHTDQNEDMVFDKIVLCAGNNSRKFASQLGDYVNIYPVKGYSVTVDLPNEESQKAAPWISLLDDETKIVASRLGQTRYRVAGTAEFNGENLDIRADRITPLIKWVRELFPKISTEQVIPWAGLRPMMPSMLPKVGRGRKKGVFYNTGHGHLGWTLSAATAEMVAEEIDEREKKKLIGVKNPTLATA